MVTRIIQDIHTIFSQLYERPLEETWNYRLSKLGACPLKTEDARRKCPNSGSTVLFLVKRDSKKNRSVSAKSERNRLGVGMQIRFQESYNVVFA